MSRLRLAFSSAVWLLACVLKALLQMVESAVRTIAFDSSSYRFKVRIADPTIDCAIFLVLVLIVLAGIFPSQLDAQTKPVDPKLALEASLAEYQSTLVPFLKQHCVKCHQAKKQEGELDLENLEPDMKTSASAARWAVVLQKLATREMPPEDEPRPSDAAIAGATKWIQMELKRSGKSVARRTEYHNGNALAHELLFNPQQNAPFDAPTRVRRLSPEIYAGLTRDVAKDARGVGQPFSPEGKSAFKDMGSPKIDEPITVQLIANALAMTEKQTQFKLENGEFKGQNLAKEFGQLLNEAHELTDAAIAAGLKTQFDRVLKRPPTEEETVRFTALMQRNVKDAGRVLGVRYTLAAVYLLPEVLYRLELGTGAADEQGRVRLAPREIAFALAYALTDRRPEGWLLQDAEKGKLDTREGVAETVRKLLDDPKLEKPRILRFFREYFGYDQATEVFKDDKANREHDPRVLVEDTDRLVLYILEQDKNVLQELLTTNKSFVAYKSAAETKRKRIEELAKFEAQKAKEPEKFKTKKPPQFGKSIYEAYNLTDFPDEQPVELPANERAGILTQPAWLVAWSQFENNHAILRGKWVREHLLGGVVPDIPITVDAQLPVASEKTLRERMEVTKAEYCWKCHQLMNNTGLPFERYDHFGRARTEEVGKPVDTTGKIEFVGDSSLEGPITDPVAFMHKLARSERVEQVFIRFAFRYWLGRNETLGDAASLQAIQNAYRSSGGSMKSLIVALLTSDSFLYRVPTADKK